MKVLYLEAAHKTSVRELPDPELKSGHAIVEVELCGACGTDIGGFKGVSPVIRYPVIGMGHETAGRIVGVAPNTRGLQIGDEVCMEPYIGCGACYACRLGRYNTCENLSTCGVHRPGMMATKFQHPVTHVHKLPERLTWEEGVMVEPLTIGIHANHRAGIQVGEYVVIVGAGSIGMLTALVSQAYGAIPILVDLIDNRLALARGLGIRHVFNNAGGNLADHLRTMCGGELPQVAIDCSGAGPVAATLATFVRSAGRVVFVGWPKTECTLDISWFLKKELDLFGSRNSRDEFRNP
ncbi:MAG: alcohol dehydrogenase catalytic domain-containing protein [Planctomycetota bacterium]|jgi:threonine dehydrogenase-like Zn-dependent dehydrogenase|nr:alcohol dehydrogenase catalytic domain-containing protein [Planctomycetota bacterium]